MHHNTASRKPREGPIGRLFVMAALALTTVLVVGASAQATGGGNQDQRALRRAQNYLKPYLQVPTDIGIDQPLEGSLEGKTVMFVECGVDNCKQIGDLLEEPMGILGADFVRVNAGVTPEEFAAGYDQAVQEQPDVVISAAINADFVSTQLEELEELGIPVISQATGENPSQGIDLELLPPKFWERQGRALASWISVDSDADANVLYLNESVFTFAEPELQGFEKGMKRFCPNCEVEVLDVTAGDIGTAIPGEVVSALQRNPDIDYLANSYGAQTIGVPEALAEAGLSDQVTIITQTGIAPNHAAMLQGQIAADLQQSPLLNSWALADAAARAALGQDLGDVDYLNIPWSTLLTADDITWDIGSEYFEGVDGLKEQFEALWGTS